MQERRKIFDSAKYSIKRKHASMTYTVGDFYSFTRNFDFDIYPIFDYPNLTLIAKTTS